MTDTDHTADPLYPARETNTSRTLLDNLEDFGYIDNITANLLRRHGIINPADFAEQSARSLLDIRGIGDSRLLSIEMGLNHFGYALENSTWSPNYEPAPVWIDTEKKDTEPPSVPNPQRPTAYYGTATTTIAETSALEAKIDQLVEHLIEAQSTPPRTEQLVIDPRQLEAFVDALGVRLGSQVGNVIVEHFAEDEVSDASIEQNMRAPYVTDPVLVGRSVVNTHIAVVQAFDNVAQLVANGPQEFCIDKMMEWLIKRPLQPGARAWVAELTNIWAGPPVVD